MPINPSAKYVITTDDQTVFNHEVTSMIERLTWLAVTGPSRTLLRGCQGRAQFR